MRKFKSICVFGGSNLGKDVEFVKAASELGKALAARGINIVYGGGIQGLRGCAATSARIEGSNVLGILLMNSASKNITTYTLGTEIRASSMQERFGYMFYNAEAFIALPGGVETLEGISSMAFCSKFNFHKKPIGLLNINGFYDGLISFFDKAVEQEFLTQAIRSTIISASTADQLIDQMQICAPKLDPLIKLVDWQPSDSGQKRDPDTTLRL